MSKLQIDNLVMEILEKSLEKISGHDLPNPVNVRMKKNHLMTIERAKHYMIENIGCDISLFDIAKSCYVSPFHFSRIFKTFTGIAPHQFLQSIRLKNAEVLLRHTENPITDIAFSSGFNSLEYFISAFKSVYQCAPSKYRALFPSAVTNRAPLLHL
jgi:AraC-like DNA-binding protein